MQNPDIRYVCTYSPGSQADHFSRRRPGHPSLWPTCQASAEPMVFKTSHSSTHPCSNLTNSLQHPKCPRWYYLSCPVQNLHWSHSCRTEVPDTWAPRLLRSQTPSFKMNLPLSNISWNRVEGVTLVDSRTFLVYNFVSFSFKEENLWKHLHSHMENSGLAFIPFPSQTPPHSSRANDWSQGAVDTGGGVPLGHPAGSVMCFP